MLVLDSCHDLSQSCSQCITEVAICMVRLPKDFSTQKYVLPNLLCSYQGILSVSTKRACPSPQYHVNDFPLYWFCKCKSNNYNSLSFEKQECLLHSQDKGPTLDPTEHWRHPKNFLFSVTVASSPEASFLPVFSETPSHTVEQLSS